MTDKLFLTRKINTRVPNELVDLEVKIQELQAGYKIKESSKKELFSLLYKPSIQVPVFRFPIEMNSVVYTVSGNIKKGNNFDRVVIKLSVNRLLAIFYWSAFVCMLSCTALLIQQSDNLLLIAVDGFMLLRIALFFVSCNQELNKIENRLTGFVMKTNVQSKMYTKQRA